MTAATRLRAALDALGWSQSGLAERLGISGATVRRWCAGAYEPPPALLIWLEAAAAYLARHPMPEGWTGLR